MSDTTTKIDDRNFVDAQDLVEILTDWITTAGAGRNMRIEDGGRYYVYSRAVLICKTLSDGSSVFDVRLS
jgi:hypothetical protein